MALTPKQEHFCRLVASGKDYTNAYLTAYDWNGSEAGAANEGLKLANKPEIQEKIRTLIKPMEIAAQKESVNARQEQIAFIRERIAICKEKEDEQSIIRYTDMLNKINGIYKDTEEAKQEQNTVVNLDMDTLRKLSGDF
jgi:phage terminase small subunit